MTYQRYCHRRADIAFRLGIPLADVTDDLTFDYELGYMDEGACSVLWVRDYRPVASSVSSGPYTTARGLTGAGRPYTILSGTGLPYRAAGERFPDDDWPDSPPDLITQMGAGEW